MSQSTCKADAGLYAFNPSIPLVRSHSSHSKDVRKSDICVERGGGVKKKQSRQGGNGEQKIVVFSESIRHSWQESCWYFKAGSVKRGRAESAGGVRGGGANGRIVEERECVSTGNWESFKLNLQSNHQTSEAGILYTARIVKAQREIGTSTDFRALDLNAFLLTRLYTKANLTYRTAQS